MTGPLFDVVIVGGGPAGCATALMTKARAPELSVALIEASSYDRLRIGETLPPIARRLLEHLRVWEAFAADDHREVHGTTASWGSNVPYDNDFVFSAAGPGWHVDRARFDAMLAVQAQRRGAIVRRGVRVVAVDEEKGTWRLRFSAHGEIRARFVVDATGTSALIGRRLGARWEACDRLVAFGGLFADDHRNDPGTVVEAFSDGWWYTAGLPRDSRIVMCVSDREGARELRLHDERCWSDLFHSTVGICRFVSTAVALVPLFARNADSRLLDPPSGFRWLAVGDAASCFDPLSSIGIVKALRSGIFASYAVTDFLLQEDTTGLDRYGRYVVDEFEGYQRTRSRMYEAETRWLTSAFWRRRMIRLRRW